MTTALVIIDIQNDYFPGGTMELVGADAAAAQARVLLDAFRAKGLPVFHVQHIAKRAGATFFLPGTRGAEIHASLEPLPGEVVITKHFPSSFRETTLLDGLRTKGVTQLAIAGMMTHLCVDTTTRAAADLGFECALAHDACATKALAFDGKPVDAASVQTSYLAALNGSFAKVQTAQALVADLPA